MGRGVDILELSKGPDPDNPYSPPAAFISVQMFDPDDPEEKVVVPFALIDPGSDILSAPKSMEEKFDLRVKGISDEGFVYQCAISLQGVGFENEAHVYVEFTDFVDEDIVLIGRDTLLELAVDFKLSMKRNEFSLSRS